MSADVTTTAAPVRTAVVPSRRRVNPRPVGGSIVGTAIVALAVVYALAPVVWLLLASTKDPEALFASDFTDFSHFALLDNLRAVLTEEDGVFVRWYRNSVLYAVVGAAVGALVSTAAGYVFDKFEFTGKKALYALVLTSVMVPATVLALPMYLLASKVGLVNTVWAVFIPVLFNPFGVYLARVFCAGHVPGEVLEAARVDGAGELRTFVAIGLRMVAPGFATIFLFQLTSIWNNFFLPLVMLSDDSLYPLSLGLYNWNASAPISPELYPLVVIGSLLALLPLVVAFLVLQRWWRPGLATGAVR